MPKIDPERLSRFKIFVRNYLHENYCSLPPTSYCEEVVEHWLAQTKSYSNRRKEELRRTYLDRFADSHSHPVLKPSDYYCKSFIKREFYEDYKHPRLINSRSDAFKVVVGPYIKLIEEIVYRNPYFVKGQRIDLFPEKLVKLVGSPCYLETDYSSFESGFHPDYTRVCELELFRHFLYENNRNIYSIIERCYGHYVKGKWSPRPEKGFNDEYKFSVVGTRMSGDMWTSLANGFSNLMNMLFLCHDKGLDYRKIRGHVEGDDGLFALPGPILTSDDFASLGFKIKMQYGGDLSHTSFCGNVFDPNEVKLIVGPEQISRLGWTCSSNYLYVSEKKRLELLKAKAMSAYVTGKNTPILAVLCHRLLHLLRDKHHLFDGVNAWYEKQALELYLEPVSAPVISHASRMLYFLNFGIPINTQLRIERFIEQMELTDEIPIRLMQNSCDECLSWRGP